VRSDYLRNTDGLPNGLALQRLVERSLCCGSFLSWSQSPFCLHCRRALQRPVRRRLTVREPHPLRTEQAPVSPWAACPLAQSTRTCRESQSARRSPPIPWEDRSRSQIEEHCPAQTPTSRCSSRQHRRQSRFDSGSMHHLVRPVPVGEILVSIRAVHPDPHHTSP